MIVFQRQKGKYLLTVHRFQQVIYQLRIRLELHAFIHEFIPEALIENYLELWVQFLHQKIQTFVTRRAKHHKIALSL